MRLRILLAALVLPLALAACDRPMAMGSPNGIMAAMPLERWEALRDDIEEALEPRAFTVRDERMFQVTHANPADERWPRVREFRRLLVVGHPDEPWMRDAVRAADYDVSALPAVVEARDVWARGQQVILVLIPDPGDEDAALPLLDDAGSLVRADFNRWVYRRMYASGVDEEMIDEMEATTGARMQVPAVYRGEAVGGTTYRVRNDHPDPSELIRTVLVTSRAGTDGEISPEEALTWRTLIAGEAYRQPQTTETDRIEAATVRTQGAEGVQIQGIWSSAPGEWPAAGPFISRMLRCPAQDRTYLVDAWLYAPARDKYEFLLQLNAILDSFTCDRPVAAG